MVKRMGMSRGVWVWMLCGARGMLALCLGMPAMAAKIDAGPIGQWGFVDASRPKKAVIIGGSISAYTAGNYGLFLQKACSKLEVQNRAKSRLGAHHLWQRFQRQVLWNQPLQRQGLEGVWLIYHGGLNSVSAPEATIDAIRKTFVAAHKAGMKVLGLSLLPWGDERDWRWRGTSGVRIWQQTRQVVDFVLGRLTPEQALGSYLKRADNKWQPGELPDLGIDLYDSILRQKDAPLRPDLGWTQKLRQSQVGRLAVKGLNAQEAKERLELLAQDLRQLPRWYMRRDLRYMDHFHPSREGHRIIANQVCLQLPAAFDCQCAMIDRLQWHRGQLHLPAANLQ